MVMVKNKSFIPKVRGKLLMVMAKKALYQNNEREKKQQVYTKRKRKHGNVKTQDFYTQRKKEE